MFAQLFKTLSNPAAAGPPEETAVFRESLRRKVKFAMRDLIATALDPLARIENATAHTAAIPILSYHRVLPDFPPGSPRSAVISPLQFEDQMSALAERGCTTLSLDELERILAGDIPCPPRAVMVTFDDGYADNGLVAHAIARKIGVRVNFFLPTGIIGRATWPYMGERTAQEQWHMAHFPSLWRPLNWDEVRQMRSEGASFGCHGFIHRRLSRLDGEELNDEVLRSLVAFEIHLGETTSHFSIPWGDHTAYNDAAITALRAHGFQYIYTTTPLRLHFPFVPATELIPRISIREHDGPAAFARKLRGAHDWMQRLAAPWRIRAQ